MLSSFLSGWQGVVAGNGVYIAIMGVLITFTALAVISLMIAAVPHLLVVVNKFFPEPVPVVKKTVKQDTVTDDVIAAIGTALFHSFKASESK